MPLLPFRLEVADLTLDHGGRLLLPLFYPEVSALGGKVERLLDEVRRGVTWMVQHEEAAAIYRRRPAATPVVRQVRIEMAPPRSDACWTRPLELTFHALVWPHSQAAVIAYVPVLDIEVVAEDEAQLAQLLPNHVRFALLRRKAAASLRPLVWLQRVEQAAVLTAPVEIEVRTPRQRAAEQEDEKPSTLREVTSDLTKLARTPAYERDSLVNRVAEALTGRRPRSVLLVGPSGVGKTAIVTELARRRAAFGLDQTPLRATSGARLVSGMTGYGMWQERCQKLCQEAAKQKAIIHFGNLVELMEVGKYEGNQQGVASFLRPYFERGDVLAICECTPEQLAHIERQAPNLLNAFLQIPVQEPAVEQTKSILRRYAAAWKSRSATRSPPLTNEALDAVERLHRRYATYSASPGRPLRFLHNLLEDRQTRATAATASGGRQPPDDLRRRADSAKARLPGDDVDDASRQDDSIRGLTPPARQDQLPIDAAEVTFAFSAETGLPLDLLDESRPLDLRAAREWFASRVMGQEEAVELIVDLLAAIKASLTRPHRPIASLLFIGPTGVGKTEMAKALAEFLYRDARRMTRIDMSEYADPLAADRLIGGTFQEEGFLTSRIREQPFGVVLLDEFEKAHPRLFDMLLQVLGEGRLTDAAGRLADFSNAVVIMTSNLGAEEHKKASLGFNDAAHAADRVREHYLRAVRRFVRPELFNRIDRVVPFNPLDEPLLRRIARRELDLLEKRDGVRYRDVHLELTDALAAYLTDRGYNPRYGARPLKRAMERELLAPLADALNHYAQETPLAAEIEVTDRRLRVRATGRRAGGVSPLMASPSSAEFIAGEDSGSRPESIRGLTPPARQLAPAVGVNNPRIAAARRCVDLRREAFRLSQSHAVLDIENTIYRLEAIEKRLLKGKAVPPREQEKLRQLAALRRLQERVRRLADGAAALEDRILTPCYQGRDVDSAGCVREAELLNDELSSLVFDLYSLHFSTSNLVTLVVYAEDPEWLFRLATGYFRLAKVRGYEIALFALRALTENIYQRLAAGETNPLPAGEFFVGIGPNTDRKKLKTSDDTALRAAAADEPGSFLAQPQEGVVGLTLRISGPLAFPLFEPENGQHLFREDEQRHPCLVHTVGQDFGPQFDYFPPHRIDRRGVIARQPLRRQIDLDRNEIDDRHLNTKLRLPNRNLEETLSALTQQRLVAEARRWLGL